MPVGYTLRPLFAWYGDMDLAPHLWSMAGCGRLSVVATFHPVVSVGDWASRREMARACGETVAAGVSDALHRWGRPLDTNPTNATVRERLGNCAPDRLRPARGPRKRGWRRSSS